MMYAEVEQAVALLPAGLHLHTVHPGQLRNALWPSTKPGISARGALRGGNKLYRRYVWLGDGSHTGIGPAIWVHLEYR